MAGGRHIVAVGTEGHEPAVDDVIELTEEAAADPDEAAWEEEDWSPAPSRWRGWIAPGLALLGIAAWTGFFAWANRALALTPQAAQTWIALVRDWSLPVILIGVLWLIALRTSRREAARFGDAARMLSDESARLETRLLTVNRELSLAREFIAAQSRDLEALGRVAVERLSEHADRLQALIRDNGARVETIGTVSTTALDNMEKLRGQLPVIASSAKDVTNNIGNAGRTAHAQLEDMIAGFNKLNQFGQASERQVGALREMVDGALAEFARQAAQLDEIAGARFAALAERGEAFRGELDGHEVAALAAIRTRASAMAEELEQTRALLDRHEEESLTSLRARLSSVRDEGAAIGRSLRDGENAALDAWRQAVARLEDELREAVARVGQIDEQAMASARARLAELTAEAERVDERFAERDRVYSDEIARRSGESDERHAAALARLNQTLADFDAEARVRTEAQQTHASELAAHAQAISGELDGYVRQMADISAHGSQARASISESLTVLADKLVGSREALAGTDAAIARLTDGSVRLLELIQASAQHTSVELPAAMSASEAALSGIEARAQALGAVVAEAEQRGAALGTQLEAGHATLGSTLAELEIVHAALGRQTAEQRDTFAEVRTALTDAQAASKALAQSAQGELRDAIAALDEAARGAVANLQTMSAEAVAELAARLGEESASAIDRAMRTRAAEAVGSLEQAAAHAAGVGREAAVQLRDQLVKVGELAGNLERRVAQARARSQEQVDNDFARRVALITEALNSNAIDIAKAIDTEVTDTAWASYLRGDRGVFTRRAVRLLDAPEAKQIAQIYENDRDFRDHVARYIHDFEAMLRQLLSTRDGHALGVTLLSSDMGKLYVALAQAIERLRN